MAIDTLLKRRAAIDFGMPSGTRIPSGTSTAFERGTTLGLYYISSGPVTFGTPQDGWNFDPSATVWNFEPDNVVWNFGD
jgi:hypothetical protein